MRRTHDFQWFKVKRLPRYGWIVERPPAVVVVPIDADGRVWLARMHRVPTASLLWELPGGGVDPGEDVLAAGLRELEEECTLVARGGGRVLPDALELAPGMGRFPHHVVVASDVGPRGRHPVAQRDEGIVKVQRFERAAVFKMLRTGAITAQASMSALAASGWLEGRPPAPRRKSRG